MQKEVLHDFRPKNEGEQDRCGKHLLANFNRASLQILHLVKGLFCLNHQLHEEAATAHKLQERTWTDCLPQRRKRGQSFKGKLRTCSFSALQTFSCQGLHLNGGIDLFLARMSWPLAWPLPSFPLIELVGTLAILSHHLFLFWSLEWSQPCQVPQLHPHVDIPVSREELEAIEK